MQPSVNYKPTLFACFGSYITQAIVLNFAPLFFALFQADYGMSYAKLAGLVMFTFITQLVIDAVSIYPIRWFGLKRLICFAHVLAFAGMFMLGFLPRLLSDPFTGLLISVFVYSIGGGFIEVCSSPIVDSLPSEAKASTMSLLHAFYGWGQVLVILLTTLLYRAFGNWWILAVIWSVFPAANAVFLAKVPFPPQLPAEKQMSSIHLLRTPRFYLFFFMILCAGAAEQAIAQWASVFAENGLHISKMLGDLLGPCMFAIFMSIGRTIYGLSNGRIPIRPTLLCCGAGTVVCFLIATLSSSSFLALCGCALSGFFISVMWPGTLSISSDTLPEGGNAMFCLLALGGDLGCSLGPWVVGTAADSLAGGLSSGILLSIVFPLGLALLALLTLRGSKKLHR